MIFYSKRKCFVLFLFFELNIFLTTMFWTSLILRFVLRYLLSRIFMGFLFLLELYNLNFCHFFYFERTTVFNSYWGTYYTRTGVAVACLDVFWTRWYFFINLLPIFFITLEWLIDLLTASNTWTPQAIIHELLGT